MKKNLSHIGSSSRVRLIILGMTLLLAALAEVAVPAISAQNARSPVVQQKKSEPADVETNRDRYEVRMMPEGAPLIPPACGLMVGSAMQIGYPPNNYGLLAENIVLYTLVASKPAPNDFAIFQTHDPFGATVLKNAITSFGRNYTVFTPAQLTGFNFSNYQVVVLNFDDHFLFEFESSYTPNIPALQAYVGAGGVLWVQAAIQGSTGDHFAMPFGGLENWSLSPSDFIVDTASPMVAGVPNPITGSFASHAAYSGLPINAHAVIRKTDANGPPTLFELFFPALPNTDFNYDRKQDYLLYNGSTRQTAIWYLNNNVFLGGAYGPTLPAGWNVIDVADFNRDGKPDYALFNPSTRQTAIWYLSGVTFVGGAIGPTLPSGWALVAVGDFNGDCKPDYVLYNASTRQTAVWYMNNNVFVSGAFGPTLSAGWRLASVADFNGDRKTDYLLFNASTRQSAIWRLSGVTFLGGVYGPTIAPGYELRGAADFNGDTKSDYLLYNPSTRQTAIWYLNNNIFLGSAYGPILPTGWNLVAP